MRPLRLDLQYGIRTLIRNPGFSAIAVLTLALGIGANTAIFSVIDGVLLRPLPYRNPDGLVALWEAKPGAGIERRPTSAPNFVDWRDQSRSFEKMAAAATFWEVLHEGGDPDRISCAMASADFFPMLGTAAIRGRMFGADDFETGREPVVLMANSLWERRFGGDPGVIGRRLQFRNGPHTVVGILPSSFRQPALTSIEEAPEIWFPGTIQADNGPNARNLNYLSVIARLSAGLSLRQARTEMAGIGERLARAYPETNAGYDARVTPLKDVVVGPVRRGLWLLAGAVGLLLLVSCVNVANLLLSRAASRSREFAIRISLGSSPRQLFRQVIAEGFLLSLAGGAAGMLLAAWCIDLFVAAGGSLIPRADQIHVDLRALLFTFAAACLTGLVFSCAPALAASRADLGSGLKTGGRTAGEGGSRRLRAALVACEVAFTLVLLAGAGVVLRSFWRVLSIDLGYETARVVTAEIRLPSDRDLARTGLFLVELLGRVAQLPGVESAGAVGSVPLSFNPAPDFPVQVEGRPEAPPGTPGAVLSVATPGYFKTMHIALRRGRLFDDRDGHSVPNVALVSETFARRYFPGEDPVGKRIELMGLHQIVGVVADVRQTGVLEDPKPQVYNPHAQRSYPGMTLTIRTRSDAAAVLAAVRHELRAMDRTVPLFNASTASRLYADALSERRLGTLLVSSLAGLALLLTAIGTYGVISYSVAQRTREMGLRMALGASRQDVLAMVLRQALGMTAAGLAIGIPAALAATRLLASLLYDIHPNDPATFAAAIALFAAVAALASYMPARRATRVDPLVALRYE